MATPYANASRGVYYLDCLDCHEAHGSQSVRLVRRTANGVVLATALTATSTSEWQELCNACHPRVPRHHNADVYAKAGSSACSTCHAGHGGSIYTSCIVCHAHGRSFF
jgi:hypothetical protein